MAIPNFQPTDLLAMSQKTNEVVVDLGAAGLTQNAISQTLAEKQARENARALTRVQQRLENSKQMVNQVYQQNTDLLAQMNESWNANRHIARTLQKEHGRISELDKRAQVDVHRMRHHHLNNNYLRGYYSFVIKTLMTSVYATLLVMFTLALWMAGVIPTSMFILIGILILVAFFVIVIVMYRYIVYKRRTDWNHHYWKLDENMKKALEAKQNSCPMSTGA